MSWTEDFYKSIEKKFGKRENFTSEELDELREAVLLASKINIKYKNILHKIDRIQRPSE